MDCEKRETCKNYEPKITKLPKEANSIEIESLLESILKVVKEEHGGWVVDYWFNNDEITIDFCGYSLPMEVFDLE